MDRCPSCGGPAHPRIYQATHPEDRVNRAELIGGFFVLVLWGVAFFLWMSIGAAA